jgi:tetratricopeptide (TPR) repeat protein
LELRCCYVALMTNIRAFVGHSFTDDDAQVVERFLKIFEQIKAALPSFEWIHARQAEPAELAQKVMKLIADCNVFIAICTKKERVVRPDFISRRMFSSTSYVVQDDHLEWKTSDWIIQEIGLAVGRSMSLVVLLEDGCRRPGGLQGDVEFISFDRESPEKAFGQILEMFRAINPPKGMLIESGNEGGAENEPQASADSVARSDANDDDLPKADWAFSDYQSAFFWKVLKKDDEGAAKIRDAFYASDLAAETEKRAEWDANCEEWQLRFNDKGRIETLKSLHAKFPENLSIKVSYASGLSFYSHHQESAQLYEAAAALASTDTEKLSHTIEAAIEYSKAERRDIALNLLEGAKILSKSDTDLSYQLAYGISRYAEVIKDAELKIEALERIVWLKPDNDENRFDLAYAHSEAGNSDMAMHHYLSVPWSRRSVNVWNNLGVSYQHFSAPARAVEAYEMAAKGGNSLAMSNLAYRYINNGFLREAREQLDKAMATSDTHKSVTEAYTELSEIPNKETKAVEEVLDAAKRKIDTFNRLSQAICEPDITNLAALWTSPDCELTVTVTGKRFVAKGLYTVKNALSGLLATSKSTEYELIFSGEIFGRRVFGEIERKTLGSAPATILGRGDDKKLFAMLFDEEFHRAEVIESINTRHPRYYEISAKTRTDNMSDP